MSKITVGETRKSCQLFRAVMGCLWGVSAPGAQRLVLGGWIRVYSPRGGLRAHHSGDTERALHPLVADSNPAPSCDDQNGLQRLLSIPWGEECLG